MNNSSITKYWKKKSSEIYWHKIPKKTISYDNKNFKHKWFEDGLLNASYNCLDINIKKNLSKKIALYFISKSGEIDSLTYEELLKAVKNFSFYLQKEFRKKNIKKVIIHSSASLESAICMLSCCRLGIIHNVLFESLEDEAIEKRIKIFKPDIFISRCSLDKLKKDVILTVKKYNLSSSKKLNIIFFSNKDPKLKNVKNIKLNNILKMKSNSNLSKCKYVKSNQSLFTLFTSGSTGMPKGIVHSTGGYLTYTKYTCKEKFNLNENSIMLTASDAGWINGHTYALYGSLMLGATSILIEDPISLINKKILNKILYELHTTILYLPVTLIRVLRSLYGDISFKKTKLKTIGSMGESLAPEVGKWFANFFNLKNHSIINTYFQTETCGVISSPLFSEKIKEAPHGSVGKPDKNLGLIIEKNKKIKKVTNICNEIKITNPWPGCMKNILGGIKLWKKYFDAKGNFRLFDTGSYDSKGNLYIHGRTDDVMTIRGHRVGSAEIESLLLKIKYLVEVCAVSIDDQLDGTSLIVFVVCKKNIQKNDNDIKKVLISNFGSFVIPKKIIQINQLPKTKSGKILRRLLRDLLQNKKDLRSNDFSTLINKDSIKDINKSLNRTN